MRLSDRKFLLCFGSQRGGTTWLDSQLRGHPDFSFPPRKELRYLDPLYVHDFDEIQKERIKEFRRRLWNEIGEVPQPPTDKQSRDLMWNARYALVSRNLYDDDWYESLFQDCDETKVTGDFSPDYSLLPDEGVAHLARILPQAKLIFIARNPVDRAISGSTYVLRNMGNLNQQEAEEKIRHIARTKLQYDFSDYKSILQRFGRYFPEESILVLFHDDIKRDPFGLLRKVCDHVSVRFDENIFPNPISKSINRSPQQYVVPEDVKDLLSEKLRANIEWMSNRYGGTAREWSRN